MVLYILYILLVFFDELHIFSIHSVATDKGPLVTNLCDRLEHVLFSIYGVGFHSGKGVSEMSGLCLNVILGCWFFTSKNVQDCDGYNQARNTNRLLTC